MIIVRIPIAPVHGDVELVGTLHKIETVNREHHLSLTSQLLWSEHLDVRVRSVAADPVGGAYPEQKSYPEHEVGDHLGRLHLQVNCQPLAGVEQVPDPPVVTNQRHIDDLYLPRPPAALRGAKHVRGRLSSREVIRRRSRRTCPRRTRPDHLLSLGIAGSQLSFLGSSDIRDVGADDARRVSERAYAASVEPQGLIAEALHQAQSVGDQQDGLPTPFELRKLVQTPVRKPLIANRQDLIHE